MLLSIKMLHDSAKLICIHKRMTNNPVDEIIMQKIGLNGEIRDRIVVM